MSWILTAVWVMLLPVGGIAVDRVEGALVVVEVVEWRGDSRGGAFDELVLPVWLLESGVREGDYVVLGAVDQLATARAQEEMALLLLRASGGAGPVKFGLAE